MNTNKCHNLLIKYTKVEAALKVYKRKNPVHAGELSATAGLPVLWVPCPGAFAAALYFAYKPGVAALLCMQYITYGGVVFSSGCFMYKFNTVFAVSVVFGMYVQGAAGGAFVGGIKQHNQLFRIADIAALQCQRINIGGVYQVVLLFAGTAERTGTQKQGEYFCVHRRKGVNGTGTIIS